MSCTWSVMEPGRPVTIGRPLPTYRVLILDPDGPRSLPPGETGEIAVAGIGVAQGYLNRPDQTAAAFVPDFVGVEANPGGCLYRTGDLGRFTPDGEIEYLGRIDTQVKIRGYRIELSEIEAAARTSPGVGNAVAATHTVGDGNVALALWLAPALPGGTVEVEAVHGLLRSRLPAYMVPAFYEVLVELPLLPSGKVDRRALPEPVQRHGAGSGPVLAPRNQVEGRLAELLSQTLGLPAVPVDADFFDDLGADSLTMAGYLTALRSSLGVRRVTLKQLYQNPTIAALAAFIPPGSVPTEPPAAELGPTDPAADRLAATGRAPGPVVPVAVPTADLATADLAPAALVMPVVGPEAGWEAAGPPRRRPSRAAHAATGAAQAVVFVLTTFLAAAAGVVAYRWVGAASGWAGTYLRLVGAGAGLWLATVAGLIAVKWLAVGRFTEEPVPLWSLRYLRFWVARRAVELNPMVLLTGTPAYNLFLRAVGVKVGPGAVILTRPPVCTDLVTVGAEAVLRHEVVATGYEAVNGWIVPGRVTIGDRALVGDGSVLAPGSAVGAGAQLGPASGLLGGQRVPAGAIWQGSPAEPSAARFDRCDPLPVPAGRRLSFTAAQLAVLVLVTLPASMVPVALLSWLGSTAGGVGGGGDVVRVLTGLALTALLVVAVTLGSAAALVLVVPRFLRSFVIPERSHALYGFQYQLARTMARFSNNRLLNTVFGDSAMIVGWLSAVGYDLTRSTQTGSNFGVDQQHHNPFLCRFDRNTLVSDGLRITNLEVSASSFRVRPVAVPPDTYLGNVIRYPAEARVGPNCLIATKAAVPVDGPVRTGVGLLGSPAFEIPRTVHRDRLFDLYKQPGVLEQRLAAKLRSNVATMAAYLGRWWLLTAIGLGAAAGSLSLLRATGPRAPVPDTAAALTLAALVFVGASALVSILLERAVTRFRRLEPLLCSLYDERFWAHERFWKMNYNAFLRVFDGTPFKPLFLRLQGAEVGARVFDDGAGLTEPSLVRIGDDCMLNHGSTLQAHSLEDGTFKSDRIRLGAWCTVGTSALVHYGTNLDDGCRVDADSFVMKGSSVETGGRWQGNPARAVPHTIPALQSTMQGAPR